MVEARKEDYVKYNVPFFIRQLASRICDVFAINGVCDPMYISNIVARRTGCGNGNNEFTYECSGNELYERQMKRLNDNHVNEICSDLMGAYGCNIYKAGKSKDILLEILNTGTVKMNNEYFLLRELITIKEGEDKTTDDESKKEYLRTEIDSLVSKAINNRFIECDEVAVNELRRRYPNK
jgi:hypothetical protein